MQSYNLASWGRVCIWVFLSLVMAHVGRAGSEPARAAEPEYLADQTNQRVVEDHVRASVERSYALFFLTCHPAISDEQRNEVVEALVARDLAMLKLRHPSGVQGKDQVQLIRAEAQTRVRARAGPKIAEELANFEGSLPQRQVVISLSTVLLYMRHPLSTEQMENIITTFKNNATPGLKLDASEQDYDRYVDDRRKAHTKILKSLSKLDDVQRRVIASEMKAELAYLAYFKLRKKQAELEPSDPRERSGPDAKKAGAQ